MVVALILVLSALFGFLIRGAFGVHFLVAALPAPIFVVLFYYMAGDPNSDALWILGPIIAGFCSVVASFAGAGLSILLDKD